MMIPDSRPLLFVPGTVVFSVETKNRPDRFANRAASDFELTSGHFVGLQDQIEKEDL